MVWTTKTWCQEIKGKIPLFLETYFILWDLAPDLLLKLFTVCDWKPGKPFESERKGGSKGWGDLEVNSIAMAYQWKIE